MVGSNKWKKNSSSVMDSPFNSLQDSSKTSSRKYYVQKSLQILTDNQEYIYFYFMALG